ITTPGGTGTSTTSFAVTPGATISPSSGSPGTQVTLSATGLSAFEAVDVYVDTTDKELVIASGSGTVQAAVTIPGSAGSRAHWVSGVGRDSGVGSHAPLPVQDNWPQRGGAASHHGYNRYENVLSPTTVAGLGLAWEGITGNATDSSPAVSNGVVYVGSNDGNLYAYP